MGFFGKINSVDTDILLRLNDNFSDFWDGVMFVGTDKVFWVPLFLTLLYVIIKNKGRESILILAMVIVLIFFSDSVSTLIKEWTQRLRPSHDPGVMFDLHIVNGYRGGLYSFVSSHAANSFALGLFLVLLVRNFAFSIVILGWAAFHSYTRMYLGVHYPFDVFMGMLLGFSIGYICFRIYTFLVDKFHFFKVIGMDQYKISHTKSGFELRDVYLVTWVALLSFTFLLIVSSKILDFMS